MVRERVVPVLALIAFAASIGCAIWRFNDPASIVSGALRIDDLALILDMLFSVAGIGTVLLSVGGVAPRQSGHGEYHALLLFSVIGMAVFVSAQNLVTLFIGIELLSIPLYVLCASETTDEHSLESGLKYLVIGSVGSATLAYGLALVYGATGATDFSGIASAIAHGKMGVGIAGDPMLLTGVGLSIVGFAFKASVAPFHQWTPDVYEGAPTPITAFMATATKAAALGVFVRFFDVAAIGVHDKWAPLVAAVAAITIVVGNVGALGQSSLKRMLGYSGVAQAGYMLGGVVVATRLGVQATVLYLIAYLVMNFASFAVVVARERDRPDGDDLSALAGLGARNPWLAWPMTIAMLALAGIPGTVGFIGKFQLIHALVDGNYTWLAIVLVIGSMISLGYYLRVVATIWMRAPVPAPLARLDRPQRRARADRRRLARGRRRGEVGAVRAPRGDVRRGGGRRGGDLLRDLPLAAVQPRFARRPGPRAALAGPRGTSAAAATISRPCSIRSRASPRQSASAWRPTSRTSTGPCSRWSTCPRPSRARCSRATRDIRGRCGDCSSTSSPTT